MTIEMKSEWWAGIWPSDRGKRESQADRTVYAKALVHGRCCTNNYFVLSFTFFCPTSGEVVSLPLSKMDLASCILTYTFASFEPQSISCLLFLLYPQLFSPWDISLQDIMLKSLWPKKKTIKKQTNTSLNPTSSSITSYLYLFLLAKFLE